VINVIQKQIQAMPRNDACGGRRSPRILRLSVCSRTAARTALAITPIAVDK